MRKWSVHHTAWAVALAACLLAVVPALADSGANHRTQQAPPVKMGTSGGSVADHSNAFCCGGTLGSLVLRDGVLSILSNNHILARSGSAAVGEDTLQPGLIDTGCNGSSSNVVGDFPGNYVPLGSANVDAAISTARANVDTTGAIIDIGVPCSNTQTPAIGMSVTKSGRTTGQTFGSVQATNLSVSIQYQRGCNSGKKFTVSYTNQVSITPGTFSAGGDSGSLIVSNDGTPNPVALLFAGSSSITVGNPIQSVVSAFQAGGHSFSFLGNSCLLDTGTADQLGLGPTANDVDFARAIKERHEADLFARAGVIGVGIGADQNDPTEPVIMVYVESGKGSRAKGFPTDLEGVKVRVIPTDPIVAFQECAE
jgi:hypothetical protein